VAATAVAPNPTAGLNAPPEMGPTANAPAMTVKPMAIPKYELPAVAAVAATLSTTSASAAVKIASADSAWSQLAFAPG